MTDPGAVVLGWLMWQLANIPNFSVDCLNGWMETVRWPSCNYTGGHYCERNLGHSGKCRCGCGSTTTTKPQESSDG